MILTSLLVTLSWAGISAVLFFFTFVFYLALINLRDVQKSGLLAQLHITVRGTAYSIVFIGIVLDALLNWFFLTVTYLELPREFLSSARVVRHKHHSQGWRHSQSIWWCNNWLAPFDDGHC